MLQVFHLDAVKAYLDVAYVASVCYKSFWMLHMLQVYVQNVSVVLDVYCKYFI
jgi:hypothetical protein